MRVPWRSSRRMVIWAPLRVSVMEVSFGLVAQPAGSKTKPPPVCAGGGWGVWSCFCLPDPRRRVHNDAYYDHAYDDRFHCKGSGGAEGAECVHRISGICG